MAGSERCPTICGCGRHRLPPTTKLTEQDVREFRDRYASGSTTLAALASDYDVNLGTIYRAIIRQTWRHVQ